MSTRTKVAAVLGGTALAGTMLLGAGAGDAFAWKTGGEHPATGTVTATVPTVTLKNVKSTEMMCITYLYSVSALPTLERLKPKLDRAMADPNSDPGDIADEAEVEALNAQLAGMGQARVPAGETSHADFTLVPVAEAKKADAYAVMNMCATSTYDEETDETTMTDYDLQVFGIGKGQPGKSTDTPSTGGGAGSSDALGSLSGGLPDLGKLFG